ncbi:hypothetical protein [Vibrio mangrovi]|uniref:Uncharacterized protein n=1 Tax=Vibrio mangrovi TaxID=474394 RepID=A0A1Y6IS64_9VIBR|nr:hypothetical protein [Vibrio mangrovi]MDW6003568.1 hypothetical protein [Vibrio mangrovi]SMR99640.1 hypothetical protein VIM7927_00867 [Vibrio mangrovi]
MKKLLLMLVLLSSNFAFAGVDLSGTIERVHMNGDKLWLKMSNTDFDRYCKPGWYGFNLYIPVSDKSFPYYNGLVTSALATGQSLYIANISHFNGSGACDLTKTGYGIVVHKAF